MKAFTRERREVEKAPRWDPVNISIGVNGARFQDTRENTDSRDEMEQQRWITAIANKGYRARPTAGILTIESRFNI